MKLQHEDGENYRASRVTTQYDNQFSSLEVDDKGVVKVENRKQAKALQEDHGQFEVIEGDIEDLQDYVLADKNVGEVKEYIKEIENVDRLKELREKEDRKTAIQHIDDRIAEVKQRQEQVVDAEFEEVNEQKQEQEENNDEVEE